jgi:pSer/pThr/pTyr-binding forkhead associated (FHA) protein
MSTPNFNSPAPDSSCHNQPDPILGTIGSLASLDNAGPTLRLVAIPGARIFEFRRKELVVGRHSSTDLQLPKREVSRFHCRLFHAGEHWHVEDMDSLNGTIINGEQVQHSQLQHNDVLRVADYLFQIDLGAGEDHAEEPRILEHPGSTAKMGADQPMRAAG